MTNFSTLRSRRFASRQIKSTQQIVSFCLGNQWFALPILALQKVISLEDIELEFEATGIGSIEYEHRDLLVIDPAQHIFNRLPRDSQPSFNFQASPYLIIMQDHRDNAIGLPISSQPVMYRVRESDFKALSQTDLQPTQIPNYSSQAIKISDRQSLLLLDLQPLIQQLSSTNIL